ncbi:MAG: hypothetical protein WC813_00985 [Patescibacteria group bacterium]|jgi:hypothetical protein
MPFPLDQEHRERIRRRQHKLSAEDQADIMLAADPTTSLDTLEDNPAVVVRIEDAWDARSEARRKAALAAKHKPRMVT